MKEREKRKRQEQELKKPNHNVDEHIGGGVVEKPRFHCEKRKSVIDDDCTFVPNPNTCSSSVSLSILKDSEQSHSRKNPFKEGGDDVDFSPIMKSKEKVRDWRGILGPAPPGFPLYFRPKRNRSPLWFHSGLDHPASPASSLNRPTQNAAHPRTASLSSFAFPTQVGLPAPHCPPGCPAFCHNSCMPTSHIIYYTSRTARPTCSIFSRPSHRPPHIAAEPCSISRLNRHPCKT